MITSVRIAANQEHSPFLNLPAEIRVRIYEYALGGNVVRPACIRKTDVTPGRVARYRTSNVTPNTFRNVIMSCRAVQAETELVLYSANIFFCVFDQAWFAWFRLLDDKKRAAIRTIKIDLYKPRIKDDFKAGVLQEMPNLKLIIIVRDEVSRVGRVEQALLHHARASGCQVVFEEPLCPCRLCRMANH